MQAEAGTCPAMRAHSPIMAARPLVSSAEALKGPRESLVLRANAGTREAAEKSTKVRPMRVGSSLNCLTMESPVASSAPRAATKPSTARGGRQGEAVRATMACQAQALNTGAAEESQKRRSTGLWWYASAAASTRQVQRQGSPTCSCWLPEASVSASVAHIQRTPTHTLRAVPTPPSPSHSLARRPLMISGAPEKPITSAHREGGAWWGGGELQPGRWVEDCFRGSRLTQAMQACALPDWQHSGAPSSTRSCPNAQVKTGHLVSTQPLTRHGGRAGRGRGRGRGRRGHALVGRGRGALWLLGAHCHLAAPVGARSGTSLGRGGARGGEAGGRGLVHGEEHAHGWCWGVWGSGLGCVGVWWTGDVKAIDCGIVNGDMREALYSPSEGMCGWGRATHNARPLAALLEGRHNGERSATANG